MRVKLFFWFVSKMCKRELFKLVRVKIENKVTEVQKMKKTFLYFELICNCSGRVADIKAADSLARFRPFSKSHTKCSTRKSGMRFFSTWRHLQGQNKNGKKKRIS